MDDEMLKVNILTITIAGLLMTLTGVLLFIFRDWITRDIRFFLPIPPLGVAAYVFVFNMFRYYDGVLPADPWVTVRELILAAIISGVVFCAYITANVVLTNWLKGIL